MKLNKKLIEFKNLKGNRYNENYILETDNKIFLYNIFDKNIYDVTEYENEDSQIIYSVLERYINNKVQVINFIRDNREDHGDDGGYVFYVGIYKNKYILGSNLINYNIEFSEDFKTIDGLEDGDENIEYRFFDTLYEIDIFISNMFNMIEDLIEEYDEDWNEEILESESEEFISDMFDDRFMLTCIKNLGSAFSEDLEINKKNLLRLTIDSYIPRLYDPIELYDGYIEEVEVEAIELKRGN